MLDLLDVMGMKQYQEKFQQEQVNGEILAECDEDVLTKDLGVSSRLHRMRLLKIISGKPGPLALRSLVGFYCW